MREIKFRMWNNSTKHPEWNRYYYDDSVVWDCLKYKEDHISHGCVFEQFTGIKDIKGKDVYEGDVISAFSGRKYIVKFDNLAFSLYSIEYKNMRWGNLFRLLEMNDDFEVIGNIYENKALLN